MNALIIIPARMGSERLPDKPLADILGRPMINHVLERAVASGSGPVYVAAAQNEIAEAVERAGGRAVLTDPDLPSGSDRVWAAAQHIDPQGAYDIIVNVQGDMPTIAPDLIRRLVLSMGESGADIVTAAVETSDRDEIADPNVVKLVMNAEGRALYFSRAAIPHGNGPVMHHIGIYAYRRAALKRFCARAPSLLEQRERLEQLRALENGMHIDVVVTKTAPHGVDTPEDLQRAIRLLKADPFSANLC